MSVNLIASTDTWMTRPRVSLPRRQAFYPSEASTTWIDSHGINRVAGSCLRRSYFRYTGEVVATPPDPYSEWIFALGISVEKILIEQWKCMGIWVANNIKFYDQERNISGELDSILTEPDGTLYGVEVKSFYGYQATRDLIGNTKVSPAPKTSQLLQTLVYIDQCKNLVDYFKMVYYARDSANRTQFDITLTQDGEFQRPTVNGVIDYRFTMEDIYDRYALLAEYVAQHEIPPRDYEIAWDPKKIEERKAIGEVSKTAYEAWKKNNKSIGDWQCFAPDTLVWMADGLQKPICEIKVGESVIGLDGPTRVVRTGSKPNKTRCLKIKPACILDTVTTEDHKWLTASWGSRNKYYTNSPFYMEKTKAQDLVLSSNQNQFMSLLVPAFKNSFIPN